MRSYVALIVPGLLLGGRPRLPQTQTACVSQPVAIPRVDQRWSVARARAHAIACEKILPNVAGFAIAVAVDGKLVWSEAFGYADIEARRQATPQTQFRIGSVSKPLTADAVAQLYESGKLDLDAPVQRYVPTFPDKGDLVRFGAAHLSPGFLKGATLELLFTPQHTTSGEATPYGIGWFVSKDTLGHRVVTHGGGSIGGTTAFGVDRDSRVVFALVTNVTDARIDAGREIRLVFDSAAVKP